MAKPKVRPLRDKILVKRLEEDGEKKVGGIIIPDSAKEKPQQAEVVAVGSGRVLEDGKTAPLTVKAGDRVLVGKWSGSEVKIDGEEYLILKEDEVLGILSYRRESEHGKGHRLPRGRARRDPQGRERPG
jgi:chaperonin GroES